MRYLMKVTPDQLISYIFNENKAQPKLQINSDISNKMEFFDKFLMNFIQFQHPERIPQIIEFPILDIETYRKWIVVIGANTKFNNLINVGIELKEVYGNPRDDPGFGIDLLARYKAKYHAPYKHGPYVCHHHNNNKIALLAIKMVLMENRLDLEGLVQKEDYHHYQHVVFHFRFFLHHFRLFHLQYLLVK
uniref:Uncharacterized protein n=1 Tax=Acrobeloides nanus TaxID=290746 RepID=A0A914CRD5_9BILA